MQQPPVDPTSASVASQQTGMPLSAFQGATFAGGEGVPNTGQGWLAKAPSMLQGTSKALNGMGGQGGIGGSRGMQEIQSGASTMASLASLAALLMA